MATTTTKSTKTDDLSQKLREQLLSTVQQGQALTLDAAETWVKAVSAVPLPELPAIPGLPDVPDVSTATNYAFDVASDLLTAQREFAVKLTKVLTPVTSA